MELEHALSAMDTSRSENTIRIFFMACCLG